MPTGKQDSGGFPDDLKMLDELIRCSHQKLLESLEKHVKLGDFIKMIELRRKLAPGDSDQKQFWRMLERIRQEELAGDGATGTTGKKTASRRPRRRKT